MPYPYDNRGLLGRWQNPMQRPMLGPQPGPQPQPRPPQNYGQMPWDQSQGQGFADMYAPKPKPRPAAARPPQPAVPPIQMPMEPPLPDQMPSSDPGMSAYGMPAQGASGMQMPKPPMQYDAAMAAYPDQPQVQRQPQPGEQATGDNAGDGQFFGFKGDEWLKMGLALMTGANQNGGSFEPLLQTVEGIGQTRREDDRYKQQMERQAEQDAMQKELHGLQVGELQYSGEQRQRIAAAHQQAIESTADPQLKSVLASMSPDQYGAFLGQRMISKEEAAIQDARLESELEARREEGRLERASRERLAKIQQENENSIGKAFQTRDAGLIAEQQAAALQIDTNTLPALRTLLGNIKAAGQYEDSTGQPIDANTRIKLSQVFNGSSAERQSLETWRGRMLQPAISAFANTGPLAAQEVQLAMDAFANPNMELGSAVELVEEMIAQKERQLKTTSALTAYYNQYGGITAPKNAPMDANTFVRQQLQGTDFYAAGDPNKPKAGAAPSAAAKPPPTVGTKQKDLDGNIRVFVGGDPNDAKSWQIVQPPKPPPRYQARAGGY